MFKKRNLPFVKIDKMISVACLLTIHEVNVHITKWLTYPGVLSGTSERLTRSIQHPFIFIPQTLYLTRVVHISKACDKQESSSTCARCRSAAVVAHQVCKVMQEGMTFSLSDIFLMLMLSIIEKLIKKRIVHEPQMLSFSSLRSLSVRLK